MGHWSRAVQRDVVMPDGKYYRSQAQLCARLALAASDPQAVARYNELTLEYLAKADELEPEAVEQTTPAEPIVTDQPIQLGRTTSGSSGKDVTPDPH